MIPSPREPGPRNLRRWHKLARRGSLGLVRAGGAACVVLGTLLLLAWPLDLPAPRGAGADTLRMQPFSALAFVLCGLAVVLHASRPGSAHRRAARGLAQCLGVVVAGLALAAGAGHFLGAHVGSESFAWLVHAPWRAALEAALPPATAAAFGCVGVALALLPLRRVRTLVQGCAAASAIIGVMALVGHFWGAPELAADDDAAPALQAAIGFVLLGVTIWLGTYRLAPGLRSLRFLLDPIELSIIASFLGALVLLTVVGGLSYRAAAESARITRQLAQVELFHAGLTGLYADATEAVVAGRSFLATGERRDAVAWMELAEQLEGARNGIAPPAELTPAERAAVAAFAQAIEELASNFRQALDVYRREGVSEARLFLAGGADRREIAAARASLQRIQKLAHAEQGRQQQLLQRQRQDTLDLSLVLLVVAALMLAAVFTAIRREMGARALAERALRRRSAEADAANRFLGSVIENIPLVIFIKEAKELRFTRINRAGERLFGYREEDVLGKTDHDFFPREEAAFFIGKDREVLAAGTVLDIPQEEIHTATHGVRLLHTRKLPLLDEHGRPTHLLGISEDVTDIRQKERQIRELNAQLRARAEEVERINQARSTFLATMSHEIRTPMNGMIGMIELLGLGALDEGQRQKLGVIAESGQSLLRIIDDVLDFSKVEAGKLELHEEVASVADIVAGVRAIHAASAIGKGLAITTHVDPALSPAVWVDPLRLRQILNNFVSNAVKFTEAGEIAIRAEVLEGDAERQLLRLSVTDTGAGISPQDQQRLFQPFVQVGQAGTGTTGGTGLGLVISRQLAVLMGGSVELRSAVGAGTTLSVRLPVRIAPSELLLQRDEERVAHLRQVTAGMRQAPTAPQAQAEGSLVLVVDDHPVNRLLLQQQLAILGYATEAVQDGAEALRRWASGRFALVLTDCQMPGMDGYELTRRLREGEVAAGRRRAPVIACTAMALPQEVDKCRAAGMDDILFKPVELGALLEKMRRWLPLADPAARAAPAAPPRPARRREEGPVDIRMLEETWGSSVDDVQTILVSYARSAREDYSALRDAVARRDAQGLMHAAHRMLGASKMVGAHALGESCALVTVAAREGAWHAITAAMQAVEAEYARVMASLQEPE